MILGGIFKFLSLFFDDFKIDKVMSSETMNDNFQILFFISARFKLFIYIFNSYIFLQSFKTVKD